MNHRTLLDAAGTEDRITFGTGDPLRREDLKVAWEESFECGDVAVVRSPE